MIVSLETLKTRIHGVVLNKGEQGHVIDGLISKLESLPKSHIETPQILILQMGYLISPSGPTGPI